MKAKGSAVMRGLFLIRTREIRVANRFANEINSRGKSL